MHSFHILVVEDFERFRTLVCTLLQQNDHFRVSEASDGHEAIQQFRALAPDLMLLDIGLPEVNGLDVARKLNSASRILFLSQESSWDVVEEALRFGAGYVHKRDVRGELLPAIETVLEGKQYVSSSLKLAGSDGLQGSQSLVSVNRSS